MEAPEDSETSSHHEDEHEHDLDLNREQRLNLERRPEIDRREHKRSKARAATPTRDHGEEGEGGALSSD